MQTLTGKRVAITGAASGMGRALAIEVAGAGGHLAIVDVDETGLEETAGRARALGADVDARRLDVSDRDAIYAWAASVEADLGGADVLVNNAGVSLSATVDKMTDADFEWLFAINFWGVTHGCRAFLPQLRARPEAHIVNLSSVFGLIGVPSQSAYCAAKFAVRGFTESLRQELAGTTVHVSCVHPGGIQTNIVRKGRHYQDILGDIPDPSRVGEDFDRVAGTTAEQAAKVIFRGILRDAPRILIGRDARIIDLMARIAPRRYDRIVGIATRAGARRIR